MDVRVIGSWPRRCVCVALLALLLASCSARDEAGGSTALPQRKPAYAGTVYVSNEDSGDVSEIDVASDRIVRTFPVGKRPRGLRLSADDALLYVALSGSPKAGPGTNAATLPPPDRSADGIAVVELATHRVLRVLPSGADPEAFDLSADGEELFVSNEDAAQVSVIDARTGSLHKSLSVGGEPEGVTRRPDGAVYYVTSEREGEVDVIDAREQTVIASLSAGLRPRAIVFSPDSTRAYVSAEGSAVVQVVDAQRHVPLARIAIPGEGVRPMGLVLSKDGGRLFVTTGRAQSLAIIDTQRGRVLRVLPQIGARPWGIGLSPDGRKLYTANGPSNDVSVIDVASGRVLRRIEVGSSPWGIAVADRPKRVPADRTGEHAAPGPTAQTGADAGAQEDLEALQRDDGQWVMAGKDYANTRHSGLREIDASNVKRLGVAWSFATGLDGGHEAAPLVIGDSMYVTTPFPNRLIALDLTQPGKTRWVYEPRPDPSSRGVACCDVVNRGAAYAGGKLIFNTLDNHTIAVDARSGSELWRTRLGEIEKGESMTMAPLVVRDKVLVGNSGGEFGVRGWLSALDLHTGAVAWQAYSTGTDHDVLLGTGFRPFYGSERGVDLGVSTWPAGKWETGGGTVWGFLSYDPQLDLVYYGTGNPGPWNPEQRPGDNKWTCGVFARTPSTGDARWFYQFSPHDVYDHDGINENILAELEIDGVNRPVIINAGRTGYVYVIDRRSGEVLSATPFVHITSSTGVDTQSGRLIHVKDKIPRVGRTVREICPAAPGGKDWQPAAFSPQSKLLYIPANNLCMDEQDYEASYVAGTPYLGANVRMYAGPGGYRGELVGWDVAAKRARFRRPERFPIWSGVLVTDGGLVFYATMDGWIKALRASDGELLWQHQLQSGSVGQPITYRGPDGRQYVAIFAGVGGWAGAVVTGKLDTRDKSAALGFAGAMQDLKQHTTAGGRLYSFALQAGER